MKYCLIKDAWADNITDLVETYNGTSNSIIETMEVDNNNDNDNNNNIVNNNLFNEDELMEKLIPVIFKYIKKRLDEWIYKNRYFIILVLLFIIILLRK